MEHDRGDQNAEKDSDDSVSDRCEMGIWCEALEDAHEKSEGDLQSRVRNPFAACRNPSGQRRAGCGQDGQRNDALHVWHELHDGGEKIKGIAKVSSPSSRSWVERSFTPRRNSPLNADLFVFASTAIRRGVELATFFSKRVSLALSRPHALNEYKRLAWRAFRRLGRREEEVGTGCAKEQTRQGKDGTIDALFLHGEGLSMKDKTLNQKHKKV